MKNIVIIGNSPAAVKAIEAIRAVDQESVLTLYSSQEALPFNRFLFPELLAGGIKEADVLCQAESFYKNLKVELKLDRKLVRLAAKRNKAVFEDKKEEKEEVNFDVLILADAATKLPDLKGDHREGILGLRRLTEAKQIVKNLSLAETITVQSETLWGLNIVESLRKRNKEVIWVNPQKTLFASTHDEQTAVSLKQTLESQGIRILEDNAIAEILGDSEAKAIRLRSGKVIGTEMIIFPDAGADLKLFTEAGLACASGLSVNQNFQTSAENVFAVDEICDLRAAYPEACVEPSLGLLEEQGKVVAGAITGQPYVFSVPSAASVSAAGSGN